MPSLLAARDAIVVVVPSVLVSCSVTHLVSKVCP
jgi:hypothetical protein